MSERGSHRSPAVRGQGRSDFSLAKKPESREEQALAIDPTRVGSNIPPGVKDIGTEYGGSGTRLGFDLVAMSLAGGCFYGLTHLAVYWAAPISLALLAALSLLGKRLFQNFRYQIAAGAALAGAVAAALLGTTGIGIGITLLCAVIAVMCLAGYIIIEMIFDPLS